MRRCKPLFMTLALLVVCANSAFAHPTIPPLGDYVSDIYLSNAGDYYIGQEWHDSVVIYPGITAVRFDMGVNLLGGNWNTPELKKVFFTATSGKDIFYYFRPDENSGIYHIYGMLPISGPGLYELSVVASDIFGENLTAHWTINSTRLETHHPTLAPIPAAFLLLGSGLVGLFGLKKKFAA